MLGAIIILIFVQGLLTSNAEDITIVKAPYQTQIELTSNNQFLAHAAILNCKWAVTLASALNGKHPRDIKVRSGSGQLLKNGGYHPVRNIIIHENYNPSNQYENDIALVQLWFNFKLSGTVCKTTMQQQILDPGSDVEIVGWWQNNQGAQLQLNTGLKSMSFQDCEKAYVEAKSVKLPISVFCTSPSGLAKPAVYGQSLNFHEKLQGLLVNNEDPKLPSVYVDVSAYFQWINDQLKKNTHYNKDKKSCEGASKFCVAKLKMRH